MHADGELASHHETALRFKSFRGIKDVPNFDMHEYPPSRV